MKKLMTFLMFLMIMSLAFSEEKGNINISVEKFIKIKGDVKILLFNSPDGFPGKVDKAVTSASIKVKDTIVGLTLENIKYGEYAISIFYDENSNGKLDTGFLGIPTEKVGASNNPKGKMGPPSYEDAKFQLKETEKELKIILSGVK